ncbi:MAG: chemotaxis protein CheB [Ignavibacteria bacterium]
MSGHDILVIGTSAGGLKALTAIVGGLPAGLDAAIFIVQHLPADYLTLLPQILSDTGSLPAALAKDGEPVQKGRIYVAPADHHLLLGRDVVHVVRGPRENRFRPSVDALFRSAARIYDGRVIGVVLSGLLDDGTVGLQAIKKRGGITVVQDPREAEFPTMPGSALRYAKVDHCLPLAGIAELLARAPALAAAPAPAPPSPAMDIEANVAEQRMNPEQSIAGADAIGTRTTFTCPTCNGTLWQVGEDEPARFRCHVGHSFSEVGLIAEQTRTLENALWSAVRLMEEKSVLARRMAQRRRQAKLDEEAAVYERCAEHLDRETGAIRTLILRGFATDLVPHQGA